MVETEITLLVNHKPDIDLIKQRIVSRNIQCPVYFFEYENYYQINLNSDNEEWELDYDILACFPGYEFTPHLGLGKKEIRIQITRYQSGNSIDNWGRQIETPLNETKYLVKKTIDKPVQYNPEVTVLFETNERHYHINIINGINKATGEKGYLLLNEFRKKDPEAEFFKDTLYKWPSDAFNYAFYKIQELVKADFDDYIQTKKKKLKDVQKGPRKIVREFIKSCNNIDVEWMLKNLVENVIFESRINWQTHLKTEGIENFKKYINSQNQDLCGKNFKIRSDWNIQLPRIRIGTKFYPLMDNNEYSTHQKYRQFEFFIKNDKIVRIIEEK